MKSRLVSEINSKYAYLQDFVLSLPDSMGGKGKVIYAGRNTIYSLTVDGVSLTVKDFHVPSLFNRFVYSFFRPGKARRSYDHALRLQKEGIGTAEPIGWLEERRGLLLSRSYYVCLLIDGQDIRHWETNVPDYPDMIRALAAFTLSLHRKGIYHKDYSPGNILFRRDADGKYNFSLIDINRMRFGVHNRKTLFRNFSCLNIDSESETARVAREYAVLARLNPEMMGNIAIHLLRRYKAKKAFLRRIKHPLRALREKRKPDRQ